jgi:glycogen debranching enzyme
MLDAARKVQPELYVTAELFTGSAELDAKVRTYSLGHVLPITCSLHKLTLSMQYVSALGINSLIREAMNATSPADLSNTLYMYGVQRPVGDVKRHIARTAVRRPPRALLFDCTHDNPTPAQKRTSDDFLPVRHPSRPFNLRHHWLHVSRLLPRQ